MPCQSRQRKIRQRKARTGKATTHQWQVEECARKRRGEESQILAKMGLPHSKNANLEDFEQDVWGDQPRQELLTEGDGFGVVGEGKNKECVGEEERGQQLVTRVKVLSGFGDGSGIRRRV